MKSKAQRLIDYVTKQIIDMGYPTSSNILLDRIWQLTDENFDEILNKEEEEK